MRKHWIALVLMCLAVLTASAALAQAEAAPKYVAPITRIQIRPTALNLYVNRSASILTKVTPTSRAHETITWSSSDENIAKVDPSGTITGYAAGSATITATVGEGAEQQSAYCVVKVKAAAVKSFKLTAKSIALGVGDTFTLEGDSFLPAYASDKTLSWLSQNAAVATVSADTGVVTAVSPGVTRIRAMSHNGKTAVCAVTVSDEVRVTGIKFPVTSYTMFAAESKASPGPKIVPETAIAEDKALTWASSNPLIAAVDEAGVITAGEHAGTCVITATTGNGRSASFKLVVKAATLTEIEIPATLKMNAGEEVKLNLTTKPAVMAQKLDFTWASSDEAVATVEDGVVTAQAGGTARITASANGKRAGCTVSVRSENARTVTVTAAGDITIGGDPRRPAPASEDYYEKLYAKYNGNFLGALSSYMSGTDEVTLVNLESNFTTSSQYKDKSYTLRAKPAYASILSRAGVDVVGHSNNHMLDFGTIGQRDTKNAVTAHAMSYVANGGTAVYEVNGIRVGFCAFNATGGQVRAAIENVVKRLSASSDVVVVSIHWGSEFVYRASSAQRTLGQAAVLYGADLVVGHHSHVVSGIERYKEKYIVYSLGTLSSCLLTPQDMDTFLFQQTFKVDAQAGLVESAKVKIVPVTMSGNETENDARPQLLSGAARARVLNKIKYYSSSFAGTAPDGAFE